MNCFTSGNLDLYYNEFGNEDPVVLIHGMGSDHTVWDGLTPLIKENYSIIDMDLRGHGRSSKPPGPYSIKLFSQDIYKLLKSLNISQAHFIGHSMGGCILQELAIRHPDKIRSLTLISSFSYVDSHLRNKLLDLLKVLDIEGFNSFFDACLNLTYTPKFKEENHELFEEVKDIMAKSSSIPALNESIKACLKVNFEDSLKNINIPTLIIAGEEDIFTPPYHGKRINDEIINSKIEIMEHVGHNLLLERPQDTFDLIDNFLKNL